MPKPKEYSELALGARPANATLYQWLYDELRSAILDGRLKAGTKLPSSRSIAVQHGVARGTVVSAFEQLFAEGYLDSRVGAGSFVRKTLPDKLLEAKRGRAPARAEISRASLSARGRCISGHPFPMPWSTRSAPAFRVGQPGIGVFPIELWSRVAARRMRRVTSSQLSNGDPLGFRPLRDEIAGYLGKVRGVKCTADEVVITSGSQQSLDLIGRLLLDPGDKVWVEDPGYSGASLLFRALGAEVVPVPVDDQGLDCEAGKLRCKSAKLAYITPAHQFPLGVTMSISRRLELLRWAREENAWIVEDDYDGEFRFSGRPLGAVRSLDGSDCVIYLNSFNKLLFPTVRLGFLVVPSRLVDAIRAARSITERFPPVLDQAILCDFITEGHMGHHMRRMREIYSRRLDVLTKGVRLEMDGLLELSPVRAGLHTIGWLAEGISDREASAAAADQGIETIPLSRITRNRSMRSALVLGFAAADERAIRRGIEGLAVVLRDLNRK
jgi:GntR family transcriptional regulator / MocR family aminotransferase